MELGGLVELGCADPKRCLGGIALGSKYNLY